MKADLVLAQFLNGFRERKAAFEQSVQYFAPQTAPRFNVFDFVRPNEVALSEVIASLLSPTGTHGQGDRFLTCFTDLLKQSPCLKPIPYPSSSDAVAVACESSTDRIQNRNRRIDIEVSFDDFGIAIENKPWAMDGNGQLRDYAAQMRSKYRNWRLLYLSGDATIPASSSLSSQERDTLMAQGAYGELDYGFIRDWLKRCDGECEADRIRHFIRDFRAYCKEQFFGEERMVMEATLVRDYCMQSDQNLEAALAIAQQMNSIKDELLEGLKAQLSRELESSLPGWQMQFVPGFGYASSRWKPIEFSNKAWSHLTIAFEFDMNECRGLAYGVRRRDEKAVPHFELDVQRVSQALNRAGQQSLRWPWWTWAEPKDWWFHPRPWLAVKNGEMAREIIAKVVELAVTIGPAIDVAEGVH